jgi:ACS family tartrate transporter-like MFS transporter
LNLHSALTSPEIDEARVVAKVSRRIVPYVFVCYIVNYLDRFNVSFAALEMSSDLGFSEMVYGLGASMFFVGYVLFEIPSNLIMMRVGARVWIARIMITWGLVSTAMMLVKSAFAFYLLRFLLGIAEAGFFPGMILYLTYWIPAGARARAFALFLTSTSLAGVFGGPLSGALFKLHGVYGLRGWQWLFMLEGVPAVVLGLVTLVYLVDRPGNAKWLSQVERDWLTDIIEREQQTYRVAHDLTLFQVLKHRRVWQLCLLYFSIIIGFYGIAFWLPQVVKSFSSLSNSAVAVLSAVPYVAASILMVITANHSDRTGERIWHVAVPALAGSSGLAAGVYFLSHGHSVLAFLCICVTASGIWSTLGPFWSLPTTFLSGTAAAGGVALINSIGNMGGFVGPYVIGYVKETTGSYTNGMLVLAATLLIAAGLALRVKPERARE